MIARAIREENLGEELRILYVAMTRAKEKLILTGGVRNLARSEEKWSFGQGRKEEKLSGFMLAGASSYLDWVMPALLRHPCSEEFRKEEEVLAPAASSVQNYPGSFSIHIQTRQREQQHRREQFFAQKTEEELAGLDLDRIYDQDTCRYLEKVMSGSYPYPESEKNTGKGFRIGAETSVVPGGTSGSVSVPRAGSRTADSRIYGKREAGERGGQRHDLPPFPGKYGFYRGISWKVHGFSVGNHGEVW